MAEINEAEEFAWQQLESKQAQKNKAVDMSKDLMFSQWYDSLDGTKSQGFAYKAWCAGWDAALLAEREACAKLCEQEHDNYLRDEETDRADGAMWCAKAIRGRTE